MRLCIWPYSWAGTSFSRALPSPSQPFQEVINRRRTEEDTPDSNPAEGELSSIHRQLRPQTRVRTRTRMGGKDGRMRSRVQSHLPVFGMIQGQPFLLIPSSSLCHGTWSSCFMILVGYPDFRGHTASRQRRRQGTSQLSSPTCFKRSLPV